LFGEQVGRFEDGRHAASADDLSDQKPVIEGLPRLEIVPGRLQDDSNLTQRLKHLTFRLEVCLHI
jgi:hypothetical protein